MKNNNNGLDFFSVLTLIFITLKLVGVIDWSWWLVLAPTIAPVCIAVAVFGGYLIYGFIRESLDYLNCKISRKRRDRKRAKELKRSQKRKKQEEKKMLNNSSSKLDSFNVKEVRDNNSNDLKYSYKFRDEDSIMDFDEDVKSNSNNYGLRLKRNKKNRS